LVSVSFYTLVLVPFTHIFLLSNVFITIKALFI
jgi:hypothetical protein